MNNASSQRGYTMFEVVIVVSMMAIAVLSLHTWLDRTRWLEKDARARMDVERELRLNLQSVANILRNADESTLQAFDGNGVATRPQFRRIVDAAAGVEIRGNAALLEWRSSNRVVEGVERPGDLYLVEGASSRVVAKQVPEGGFRVIRESDMLEIELSTYARGTEANTALEVSGHAVVLLRN
ncbi:MAG: type II secretion system protein [Planctomycetota bacterium]|nr:type II secretion system protein [Planctomycetota bacterium]